VSREPLIDACSLFREARFEKPTIGYYILLLKRENKIRTEIQHGEQINTFEQREQRFGVVVTAVVVALVT
jgi:hypothetical protein